MKPTRKALLTCLLCTPMIVAAQTEEPASDNAGKSNKEEATAT